MGTLLFRPGAGRKHCALTNCRRTFATTSADGRVRLHHSGSRKQIANFTAHEDAVNVLRWWGDNEILTGSDDCTAKHWDLRSTRHPLSHFTGHTGWVKNCEVLNERLCLTAAFDGTVRVWDRYASAPHHPEDMLAPPPVALHGAKTHLHPNILLYHPELLRIAVHSAGADDCVACGRCFVPTGDARGSDPPSVCQLGGQSQHQSKLAISIGRSTILVRHFDALTAAPALMEAAGLLPGASTEGITMLAREAGGEDGDLGDAVDAYIAQQEQLQRQGGSAVEPAAGCSDDTQQECASDTKTAHEPFVLSPAQLHTVDSLMLGLPEEAHSTMDSLIEGVQGGDTALPLIARLAHVLPRALDGAAALLTSAPAQSTATSRRDKSWAVEVLNCATLQLELDSALWSAKLYKHLGVRTLQGVLHRLGRGTQEAADAAEARWAECTADGLGTHSAPRNTVQRLWGSQDEHVFALRFDASGQWLALRSSYDFLVSGAPADNSCAQFQHSVGAVGGLPESWLRAAAPPVDNLGALLSGGVSFRLPTAQAGMPCAAMFQPKREPHVGGVTSLLAVDGPAADAVHKRTLADMAAVHRVSGPPPAALAAWCELGWQPLSHLLALALGPQDLQHSAGLQRGSHLHSSNAQMLALVSGAAVAAGAADSPAAAAPLALAAALACAAHPARPALPTAVQRLLDLEGDALPGAGRAPWLAPGVQEGGVLCCTVLRVAHLPSSNNGIITGPCFAGADGSKLLLPARGSICSVDLGGVLAAARGGVPLPWVCHTPAPAVQEGGHTAPAGISTGLLPTLRRREHGQQAATTGAAASPGGGDTAAVLPPPPALHCHPVGGAAGAAHRRLQAVVDALAAIAAGAAPAARPPLSFQELLFAARESPGFRQRLPSEAGPQENYVRNLHGILQTGGASLALPLLGLLHTDSVLDISVPPCADAALAAAHAVAVTHSGHIVGVM